MIISKKKYQEDIRKAVEEAVNRMEREQYIHEKIDRMERGLDERIDGLMRYFRDLEQRVESIDPIKDPIITKKLNETEGLVSWKDCPICLRMRKGEDDPR
jgi:ATP-dependent Lon protease